jgi:hypothetical protein
MNSPKSMVSHIGLTADYGYDLKRIYNRDIYCVWNLEYIAIEINVCFDANNVNKLEDWLKQKLL